MKDTDEIRDKGGLNRTEHRLYVAMKGLGLDPQPQYKISHMTVDFAFPDIKLVVEVNGPYHNTPEQRKRDKKRWYVLNKHGWKRKTFSSTAVNKAPVFCAEKIQEEFYPEIGEPEKPEKEPEETLEENNKSQEIVTPTSSLEKERRNGKIVLWSVVIIAILFYFILFSVISSLRSDYSQEDIKNGLSPTDYKILTKKGEGACSAACFIECLEQDENKIGIAVNVNDKTVLCTCCGTRIKKNI